MGWIGRGNTQGSSTGKGKTLGQVNRVYMRALPLALAWASHSPSPSLSFLLQKM